MVSFDRPRLSELFVHCPRLCQREGDEHKKILYYFPTKKSSDEQLNSVGLCEALISFTRFFGSKCQSLHTSTTRRFLHQMADDIWIVMVIILPPYCKSPSDYCAVYHEHDIGLSDQVMSCVLSTACETFEFFNGKVNRLLETEGVDTLRQRLNHFFTRYLRILLFEHCDLLDCFSGIQFTAVEPSDFARVQGFLSRVRYAFRVIQHVAFFYDGRLIAATMELGYARHLYHYLNSFLFVEQPDLNQSAVATTTSKHFGRFLVGPKNFSDLSKRVQCPVLCSPESELPDSQLVTYQALRVVLCIVVHGVKPIPMEFFARFDAVVGPRLSILADRIAANHSSLLPNSCSFSTQIIDESFTPAPVYLSGLGAVTTGEGDGFSIAVEGLSDDDLFSASTLGRSRFVYWNPFMYSVMSTLHVFTGSGRRQLGGSKRVLNLMVSIRAELLLRPSSWHEEVVIRLDPHVWVVARRSNGRELFMMFVRKQENLGKLSGYIDQLYKSSFRGLLLLN